MNSIDYALLHFLDFLYQVRILFIAMPILLLFLVILFKIKNNKVANELNSLEEYAKLNMEYSRKIRVKLFYRAGVILLIMCCVILPVLYALGALIALPKAVLNTVRKLDVNARKYVNGTSAEDYLTKSFYFQYVPYGISLGLCLILIGELRLQILVNSELKKIK